MKANEVLNLLRITRKTLHVYVSTGKIRFTVIDLLPLSLDIF